jgi:hypothetical protein
MLQQYISFSVSVLHPTVVQYREQLARDLLRRGHHHVVGVITETIQRQYTQATHGAIFDKGV